MLQNENRESVIFYEKVPAGRLQKDPYMCQQETYCLTESAIIYAFLRKNFS